jgi:lipoprotein-releasing system ATP-binding protein
MKEEGALLEIVDLVQRYGTGEGTVSVLEGIDLTIAAGESVAIMGPSGSGKSTLLHVASGLVPPTSGSVRLVGRNLAGLDADRLAELRNREIGLVFQDHHLLPQCTVLENALLPTLAGWKMPELGDPQARARELCDRVGLGARLGHRPSRLSGGERQRLALVRALIHRPRLLFADEPTGSLDARTSEELADLLCELNEELGVTLVVVTHARELASRMSRVLTLEEGRLSSPEGPA